MRIAIHKITDIDFHPLSKLKRIITLKAKVLIYMYVLAFSLFEERHSLKKTHNKIMFLNQLSCRSERERNCCFLRLQKKIIVITNHYNENAARLTANLCFHSTILIMWIYIYNVYIEKTISQLRTAVKCRVQLKLRIYMYYKGKIERDRQDNQ